MNWGKSLSEFREFNKTFQIIHQTKTTSDTSRLFILDSSFNPPHLAHYSLVKTSIDYEAYKNDRNCSTVLLLLSISNADKADGEPASLEQRIDMIILLAEHITKSLGLPAAVALTSCPKFADKCKAIQNHSRELALPKSRLTFLVGFDTIIRILDQKYYTSPMSVALRDLFQDSDFLVLTREDKKYSIQYQLSYVKQLHAGSLKAIPNDWASRIYMVVNDNLLEADISSSAVRSDIKNGKLHWQEKTIPEIATYIKEKSPYIKL
ncbi:Piso0_005682 [Millerozyma farinosa CBS 7064]|uniref:Piso0_005682 protein n=1 Tax=Pichia sorbitophila (strain ATCC MYA-4447 / BCRC 22081 / CBS 7064 / NBRC 10061 / NRRL Y-12695) TaxID=559304 RepID=G8Y2M6_PICSO|nr:Piso0_005682 [Millerozyma farinosa CBS 7064]